MSFTDQLAGALASIRRGTGAAIVYRRDGLVCNLTAKAGKRTFVQEDDQGLVVASMRTRDYLIGVADLILDGQPATPQRGDRIEETIAGKPCVFEVTSDGSIKPFEFSDSGETQFRVHTTKVG